VTTWTFDHGDVRWLGPITVLDNTTPISGFEVTVIPFGGAPTVWADPDVKPGGTDLGVFVGTGTSWALTATPGTYQIRARVKSGSLVESTAVGLIVSTGTVGYSGALVPPDLVAEAIAALNLGTASTHPAADFVAADDLSNPASAAMVLLGGAFASARTVTGVVTT
jgi:hypothetical protein